MVEKQKLEKLYEKYNDRSHVSPDPLQFLYHYQEVGDREIAGIIASALAYGRVAQIIKSVGFVLDKLGPHPRSFLLNSSCPDLNELMTGFKHRFTTGQDIVFMLDCIRAAIEEYGSLNQCFLAGYNRSQRSISESLASFIGRLTCRPDGFCSSLFPLAKGNSALKRFNLYLRWMVREDKVDPGGWKGIDKSQLIVPLDIHMHRISQKLGFTCRKQADMKTAIEITDAFRQFSPRDPVKYDFALTRLGINKIGYIF